MIFDIISFVIIIFVIVLFIMELSPLRAARVESTRRRREMIRCAAAGRILLANAIGQFLLLPGAEAVHSATHADADDVEIRAKANETDVVPLTPAGALLSLASAAVADSVPGTPATVEESEPRKTEMPSPVEPPAGTLTTWPFEIPAATIPATVSASDENGTVSMEQVAAGSVGLQDRAHRVVARAEAAVARAERSVVMAPAGSDAQASAMNVLEQARSALEKAKKAQALAGDTAMVGSPSVLTQTRMNGSSNVTVEKVAKESKKLQHDVMQLHSDLRKGEIQKLESRFAKMRQDEMLPAAVRRESAKLNHEDQAIKNGDYTLELDIGGDDAKKNKDDKDGDYSSKSDGSGDDAKHDKGDKNGDYTTGGNDTKHDKGDKDNEAEIDVDYLNSAIKHEDAVIKEESDDNTYIDEGNDLQIALEKLDEIEASKNESSTTKAPEKVITQEIKKLKQKAADIGKAVKKASEVPIKSTTQQTTKLEKKAVQIGKSVKKNEEATKGHENLTRTLAHASKQIKEHMAAAEAVKKTGGKVAGTLQDIMAAFKNKKGYEKLKGQVARVSKRIKQQKAAEKGGKKLTKKVAHVSKTSKKQNPKVQVKSASKEVGAVLKNLAGVRQEIHKETGDIQAERTKLQEEGGEMKTEIKSNKVTKKVTREEIKKLQADVADLSKAVERSGGATKGKVTQDVTPEQIQKLQESLARVAKSLTKNEVPEEVSSVAKSEEATKVPEKNLTKQIKKLKQKASNLGKSVAKSEEATKVPEKNLTKQIKKLKQKASNLGKSVAKSEEATKVPEKNLTRRCRKK
eukprot:TRINITY_DN725_c0_g1_i20.p1 TRINITY_DN725_c0_g1~~TRINITY_DN725_c0_g1_i20.p1  ORF type:complete len:801 (-),score=231.20 TRINITY_DN725_c0_g1_i20:2206-4608(-)